MKKVLAILLALVLTVGSGVVAFAAPGNHPATTTVSASDTTVFVGETVDFKAKTLKQGSAYDDEWSGAGNSSTSLTADGYYISTASKRFMTPGEFTITYTIVMSAGKSGTTFSASDSVNVTVLPLVEDKGVSLAKYEIRNWIRGDAHLNPQGDIIGYYATGDVYAVYSDGSRELVESGFEFELTKNNDNLKRPGEYNGVELKIAG